MALPALVAEAVAQRTGRVLVSGGVSLCAPKGLAVLAFSVIDERPGDAGLRLAGLSVSGRGDPASQSAPRA